MSTACMSTEKTRSPEKDEDEVQFQLCERDKYMRKKNRERGSTRRFTPGGVADQRFNFAMAVGEPAARKGRFLHASRNTAL